MISTKNLRNTSVKLQLTSTWNEEGEECRVPENLSHGGPCRFLVGADSGTWQNSLQLRFNHWEQISTTKASGGSRKPCPPYQIFRVARLHKSNLMRRRSISYPRAWWNMPGLFMTLFCCRLCTPLLCRCLVPIQQKFARRERFLAYRQLVMHCLWGRYQWPAAFKSAAVRESSTIG